MKPTNEQIKEFWERCGWKWIKRNHLVNEGTLDEHRATGYWRDPEGGRWAAEKEPDLNCLFEYAVPKLYELGYYYELLQWNEGQHKAIINKRAVEWAVTVSDAIDKDPADALFWACYKAFGLGGNQ